MRDVILVVNSGSSSLKFAVYPVNDKEFSPVVRGEVTGIGREPILTVRDDHGDVKITDALTEIPVKATHEWLVAKLLEQLQSRFVDLNAVAAGHRVVHGGLQFTGPVVVDDKVRKELESLVPLAPLHQPHNLAAIDAIARIAPTLLQVACFDTSFHRTQPRLAQLYALPRDLTNEGVIRYGFHGISYEYIASILSKQLGPAADGRVITAHLGNGASMCAMKARESVATSMGFTTLDGLVMGSRCGSLDAGVVLYLLRQKGLSAAEVEYLLYNQSGLLGVSGISNNMLVLEERTDLRAKEAVELFCYRAAAEIGALAATLGGLDALVFTAGIGENSATVRRQICERSSWLGIDLDHSSNEANARRISSAKSKVELCVIPTNEEAMIAAFTRQFIEQANQP